MKQKRVCRLAAPVLAVGLVLSLALTSGAVQQVDLTQACSITVNPGSPEFVEDLSKADVVIDLYKVADAVEDTGYNSYQYQQTSPYSGLTITTNATNEDWQALAQSAAVIALQGDEPVVSGAAAGSAITTTSSGTLNAGLYLLIARGSSLEEYKTTVKAEDGTEQLATIAQSGDYEYTFLPELISLPSKTADETGVVSTANQGDWIYDMTATLKPAQELRKGSLEIVKTLEHFGSADAASFVFQIEAVRDGKTVYSNVAALSFTSSGEKKILLENIPVGSEVTVTEVYSGSSYSLTSSATQTAVIDAADVASVAFTNDYNGKQNSGHGIANHFTYTETDGWSWTQSDDNAVA